MSKLFDLNIENVLEHWGSEDAVREIIANALDEQVLSRTEDIEIYGDHDEWHIRDYGRGIQYSHFTQKENDEKLSSPNLIGKFGVGLKDALAVFHRRNVKVTIDSRYAHVTLRMANKSGFNVETLHAVFEDPIDPLMKGTKVTLRGISEETMETAKAMFLKFNSPPLLERTKYGEVYKSERDEAVVYINGVKVAEEPNFLFTYNITNINAKIKRALNRERSNVGRNAYTDTVKNILKRCETEEVLNSLMDDLQNINRGTNRDESGWVDVASYAAETLDKTGKAVFMTPEQRSTMGNEQVEILNQSGKRLVMVNDRVFDKVRDYVTTYDHVFKDYTTSFQYQYVDVNSLSASEQVIFLAKEYVIDFLRRHNYSTNVPVRISETIRVDKHGETCNGVYDESEGVIIIRRSVLRSKEEFFGVLTHEFIHYAKGHDDLTREFENDLTDVIGKLLAEVV